LPEFVSAITVFSWSVFFFDVLLHVFERI
jgi:hypothetical protein